MIEGEAVPAMKTAAKAEPKTVVADDPEDRKGRLKSIGRSRSGNCPPAGDYGPVARNEGPGRGSWR